MKNIKIVIAVLIFAGLSFVASPVALAENQCGGVSTSIISCDATGEEGEIQDTGIWGLLLLAISILTAGIGVAALGGLIYGAVLYTSAGGSPDQIKKARVIFTNVVIGIISYAAMFSLLQFIIPGGVFNV